MLGWDPAWETHLAPFADAGRVPARVIAVHKETSIVRGADGLDRSATVSGRFRFDALAAVRLPGRRRLGRARAVDRGPGHRGPRGHRRRSCPAGRRSRAARPTRAGGPPATSPTSRSSPRTWTWPSSWPASTTTSTSAASSATSRSRGRAASPRSSCSTRRTSPTTSTGRLVAVEAIAPGVPVVVLSALTGDHLADLLPHLASGRTAVVLGSSGVGKSTLVNALLGEERQSTGAVREGDSRGRHTTTHRELFELPGGALLIDTPGIRSLEVAGADEGVEAAFDDIIELAATCRFSDCGHDGEPGCAIEAAARRRDAQRRPGGQPPEARARAGPRGPQDRPARPGRAQAQVADHPQGSRPAHAQQVRRRPMTGIAETTTPTVWLDLPDAPPVPGLRFRAFRDLADYEPMSAVMCAAARADDIPGSRPPTTCGSRTRATTGSRRPTTSSSPRSTASRSRSRAATGSSATTCRPTRSGATSTPPPDGAGSARRCSPGTSLACTSAPRRSTRGCRSSSAPTRRTARRATASSPRPTGSSPSARST